MTSLTVVTTIFEAIKTQKDETQALCGAYDCSFHELVNEDDVERGKSLQEGPALILTAFMYKTWRAEEEECGA